MIIPVIGISKTPFTSLSPTETPVSPSETSVGIIYVPMPTSNDAVVVYPVRLYVSAIFGSYSKFNLFLEVIPVTFPSTT